MRHLGKSQIKLCQEGLTARTSRSRQAGVTTDASADAATAGGDPNENDFVMIFSVLCIILENLPLGANIC